MTAQSRARIITAFVIFMVVQSPVRAEINPDLSFPCPTIDGKRDLNAASASSLASTRESAFHSARLLAARRSTATSSSQPTNEKPELIAQLGASTASEVADLAAVDSVVGKKQKNELLITDSLWGNLILDMAYQRDPQLRKLLKRFGLINMGTMAAVAGIAGGTLAQGVIAVATLNPQHGNDTYLPGAIGIGMSGLTIATFVGRAVINHHLAKCLRNRQLEIKHRVETILAKFESSQGDNVEAKTELTGIIGERATNEWVQLWRSANVMATIKQPNISLLPAAQLR